MLKIKVEGLPEVKVEEKKEHIFLNDKLFDGEVYKENEYLYKVIKPNKVYKVEILSRTKKNLILKVNNHEVEVSVTDHIDQILDKLGMNTSASIVVKDIKAPMPGSILNIMVSEGDEVAAGDALLILEAMKMENVIKSPGDGKVSKIFVKEKDNVEKNQVLISFE